MTSGAAIEKTKQAIVERAKSLGFDAIRVTRPDDIGPAGQRLDTYIESGHHAGMTWMADTAQRRRHPRALMDTVESLIMVGLSYAPRTDPLQALTRTDHAAISVYAHGRDYHQIIKGRLKELAGLLHARTNADVKVFVDTAPLMEKPLAAAAGIGWQGKHTNLVSREFGSWLFLGAILTAADLPADEPETDNCGTCRACLDICPTGAFPAPYQLDARRCIAYLTNEHAGHIDVEFREAIGNRVFGCDDCLAICPWNKFASATREIRLQASQTTDNPALRDLAVLDDTAFRNRFQATPVKRLGRDRFIRNVLIAIGNSNDVSMLPIVENLLDDKSPLVRAMAVWALGMLGKKEHVREVSNCRQAIETDRDVREEWKRAGK